MYFIQISERLLLNNIFPPKCWIFPFGFLYDNLRQNPQNHLHLCLDSCICLHPLHIWRKKAASMGSLFSNLGVGLHINIYGTAVSHNSTGTVLCSLKAYLAPTFTVCDSRWILTWETNQMLFGEVAFRVMWAQLNIAHSRIHGPRVVWGQCTVRWLGQRQQAIVCTPHVRVSIRGQVLYRHHDLSSVCVMRQHYTNRLFFFFYFLLNNASNNLLTFHAVKTYLFKGHWKSE